MQIKKLKCAIIFPYIYCIIKFKEIKTMSDTLETEITEYIIET